MTQTRHDIIIIVLKKRKKSKEVARIKHPNARGEKHQVWPQVMHKKKRLKLQNKNKKKHKEERKSLQFVALKRNNSALHPSQIQQEKHIKKQHEVTKRGNSSTKC